MQATTTIKNQNTLLINPRNVSRGSLFLKKNFFFFPAEDASSIGTAGLMVFIVGDHYKERKLLPLEIQSQRDHLFRCKEMGFI